MPDWFYRPIARNALFLLPDTWSRGLALGTLGTLGRFTLGQALIDFLGHMRTDGRAAVRVAGIDFPSRIGLGWRVDPERRATKAWERFGVGCIEIFRDHSPAVRRGRDEQLIEWDTPATSSRRPEIDTRLPVLRRVRLPDGRETLLLPNGLALPLCAWNAESAETENASAGVALQVGARSSGGHWQVPARMPVELPTRVRAWRARLTGAAPLIVAGGVANPSDARALVEAGADLVLIDAGMVFRGPGLVKRCNDALLAPEVGGERAQPDPRDAARHAWFWTCALGASLASGGLGALALAFTRVLLPYDEHFLGFTAEALRLNVPRLFAFMAHDRGTLAGTMLGLSGLYLALGWSAMRRDLHGAKTAVVASALAGFASFFGFFGFGYFDTLHAFVAAVLFQLSTQIIVQPAGGDSASAPLVEDEDPAWRRAQWAQLAWIVHAVGLVIARVVILAIGMKSIFVREDLDFLCMNAADVAALGERVHGVVAHDRATLGGMLLASGVGTLLPLLWCFRKAHAWLWWAMLALGLPAYTAAIGVHLWIGYTDWRHMLPALAGLALWIGGLVLARAFLCLKSTRRPRP
jgi:hypothetical protein